MASGDLDAMIEFAWCHLLVDKRRFLEAVDAATASRAAARRREPPQDGRLMMLQSIAATLTGDWRSSSTLAAQAIALLADDSQVDLVGRFGWNMIAREVALSERWDDGSAQLQDVRRSWGGTRSGGSASRAPVPWARRSPAARWTPCGSPPASAASRRWRPWRSSAPS